MLTFSSETVFTSNVIIYYRSISKFYQKVMDVQRFVITISVAGVFNRIRRRKDPSNYTKHLFSYLANLYRICILKEHIVLDMIHKLYFLNFGRKMFFRNIIENSSFSLKKSCKESRY